MSWWKFWWKIYWPLIRKHFVVSVFDLLCSRWLTFADCVHVYIVERGVKLLSHLPSLCLSQSSPLLNILFAPDGCEGGDGLTDPRGSTGLYSPCSWAKISTAQPLGSAVWWQPNVKRSSPSQRSRCDSQDVPAEQHPDRGKIKYKSFSPLPVPPRGTHGGKSGLSARTHFLNRCYSYKCWQLSVFLKGHQWSWFLLSQNKTPP